MAPVIHALGDSGLTITLAQNSSADATRLARETAAHLREAKISYVEEVIAAYTAVTVFYDALHVSFDEMHKSVSSVLDGGGKTVVLQILGSSWWDGAAMPALCPGSRCAKGLSRAVFRIGRRRWWGSIASVTTGPNSSSHIVR